jgi:hypothetical protein
VTLCGMAGLLCGSVWKMFVCGGATLGSAGWEDASLGGATLRGGAVRYRDGVGVSSCEVTRLSVLGGADTIRVACGETERVLMLGAVCVGSSVCGGVHAECCVKMLVSWRSCSH